MHIFFVEKYSIHSQPKPLCGPTSVTWSDVPSFLEPLLYTVVTLRYHTRELHSNLRSDESNRSSERDIRSEAFSHERALDVTCCVDAWDLSALHVLAVQTDESHSTSVTSVEDVAGARARPPPCNNNKC